MRHHQSDMSNLTLSKKQKTLTLSVLFSFAGILFALISLVNHYLFKTYALDLGLYTHALYDYAHFRLSDCSVFMSRDQILLCDHFDLYLMLLSPLVYVFGSYTLLVVQIVAVLLGGWGIHKLIGLYSDDDLTPILATAIFFFSFGIIHPFAFDYHSNVLTAMLFPWLVYFLKQKRYGLSALFVVLFVIGKENMSLWLFFIAIGLMWDFRKDKKTVWFLAGSAVFALAYFVIINMVVMPRLGTSGGGFRRYAYLGDNYWDVAKTLVTHPKLTIKLLFTSTIGLEEFSDIQKGMHYLVATSIANPKYSGIKEEFYYCALATGLVFTILKPNYLFMLVPLIGQKMLSYETNFWGVIFHYSVEFMPVIVISSFLVITKLKSQTLRLALAFALLISTICTTFYTIGVPKSPVMLDQICVYQGRHYVQKKFDVHYARELMDLIPDDASVCASSPFVPHLALRRDIHSFKTRAKTSNATYFMVTKEDMQFHWGDHHGFQIPNEFETLASDGTLYLLKRHQH